MDRRLFLQSCAAASVIASTSTSLLAQQTPGKPHPDTHLLPGNGVALPDDGWKLWVDRKAQWQDDTIYLPEDVDLAKLPVNPPTGGWDALSAKHDGDEFTTVTLPTTVEQHFWGKFGERPYTPDEYRYAADDPIPQNGAYVGVSWWWKEIDIPASMHGQRIMLHLRGARMRAEVYLNEQLVGYSIMEELPFEGDLTAAAKPGGKNTLAIRITNPGGRYDWVDGLTIRWGAVNIYRSHGFGGLDRGMTLTTTNDDDARFVDAWVLNTPDTHTVRITAVVETPICCGVITAGTEKLFSYLRVAIVDPITGRETPSQLSSRKASISDAVITYTFDLTCPSAKLWNLDTPNLYQLRLFYQTEKHVEDTRTIAFGFRWFAPEGLGANALFRLNGKRIKVYSAISWGFWGLNGVWPTPELAEREVTQAKRLGLNCLNFHRNVGKEDVFRAHDRLGLLRYMEPGGGKLSIGKLPSGAIANAAGIVMESSKDPADLFSQKFMLAKCRAMVRAYRSHPSLIQYTLQNELGADLKNPDTFAAIKIMHEEDPSRSVVMNDGFSPPPRSAAQAWFSPYNETMHRSDQEPFAGWWNNHQGANDQWYDEFYKDPDHFTYLQPLKTALVEFGEMEGCAVPDNHPLMVHQIETGAFGGNGKSYDLVDHKEIVAGYEKFLTRWGFRTAFPSAEKLCKAIGAKSYESWQQYMENVRICDAVDFAVISGWESTAVENHSGIVDNLRNFKSDPDLIAGSLRPVRAVAKQHKLCYAMGEAAVFDLYLLNDTNKPVAGKLRFSMVEPDSKLVQLGSWDAPAFVADQFSYAVQTAFTTPPLAKEGIYRFRFVCDGKPKASFTREIWVANAKVQLGQKVTVGVSRVLPAVRKQLSALPDVEVKEFSAGEHYDLIVTSGVVKGSKLDRQIGDETGLEVQPTKPGTPEAAQVAGDISEDVLAAVKNGTPLLAMVPDDFLADGVAKQLAALGAFTYSGQVGDTRAPWMGNWLFVREHLTFAGLPVNRAMSVHYQAHGKASNGLLVERAPGGHELNVIVGYSRDHDRRVGAASFLCSLENSRVLVHRVPEFSAPLQQRWLANSIAHLTGAKLG
jgi:hypothetical protein